MIRIGSPGSSSDGDRRYRGTRGHPVGCTRRDESLQLNASERTQRNVGYARPHHICGTGGPHANGPHGPGESRDRTAARPSRTEQETRRASRPTPPPSSRPPPSRRSRRPAPPPRTPGRRPSPPSRPTPGSAAAATSATHTSTTAPAPTAESAAPPAGPSALVQVPVPGVLPAGPPASPRRCCVAADPRPPSRGRSARGTHTGAPAVRNGRGSCTSGCGGRCPVGPGSAPSRPGSTQNGERIPRVVTARIQLCAVTSCDRGQPRLPGGQRLHRQHQYPGARTGRWRRRRPQCPADLLDQPVRLA